jgi:RND family efflux transporter MFP subunit
MLIHFRRRAPLLLGGLCLGLLPLSCGQPGTAPEEETHPAPVKVAKASTQVLAEWTELLGATQPLPGRLARVSAAVGGLVVSVPGDGKGKALAEGQQVDRGQVIARLDDRVARANRDQAKAALDEMGEQAKQADYAVSLARIDLDRLEMLKPNGMAEESLPLVSRIDLARARIALKDAESRQRLIRAKTTTARAALKGLQEQLDLYTIRAPIAGRLGMVRVAPGQALSPGSPVADIVDLGEIDVLCFAPPHLVGRLDLKQPARLASAKDPATGQLTFLAAQAETESGNFAVKVRFPNPKLRLLAGRVERVQVRTQPESKRQVIPEAALLEDQEPPRVVVVEDVTTKKEEGKEVKSGKARRLEATIGVREPRRPEAVAGGDEHGPVVQLLRLTDPETHKEVPFRDALFVVDGAHGLQTGDPVRIVEDEHEGKEP